MLLTSGPVHDRIVAFNEQALAELEAPDCVTHLEGFLGPDGQLVFCEVAARPGGGWIDRMILAATGVDLIDSAVRVGIGLPLLLDDARQPSGCWACVGLYRTVDNPQVVERVGGLPAVKLVEQVLGRSPQASPAHCTDYALRAVVRAADPMELDDVIGSLTRRAGRSYR
jgi:hypothetical protein